PVDIVGINLIVAGMFLGDAASETLLVDSRVAARVIAEAEPVVRAQVPVDLAQVGVHILPELIGREKFLESDDRFRCSAVAGDYRLAALISLPIVAEEEEEPILDHRTAQCSAELIVVVRAFR